MTQRIQSTLILGGGTAGLLTALTLKARLPHLQVRVVRSERLGVIGVGEATTPWFVHFLHNMLGLDRAELYRAVHPVWKLGNRLEWGPPDQPYFDYPFGGKFIETRQPPLDKERSYYCLRDGLAGASLYGVLMEQRRSPIVRTPQGHWHVDERFGYHVENKSFIEHLERVVLSHGMTVDDVEIVDVEQSDEETITGIMTSDGQLLHADLFVDCSGFRARLIGEALGEPFVEFGDSLFCDRAVISAWPRGAEESVNPYTTASTMNHGWCWRTEFEHHVNRGYVYSSQFCSDQDAAEELVAKNPRASETRLLQFPTGRRRRFWVGNVASVGNASGFVEPLESTGLQMIGQTAVTLANCLADSDATPTAMMKSLANEHIGRWWEDIRGFLAVHYRFNQRLDTPFWQHCRADTELGVAGPIFEFYRRCGPSGLSHALIPKETVFGYGGYLAMFLGQRVPTEYEPRISDQQWAIWQQFKLQLQRQAEQALLIEEALEFIHRPEWRWS